MMLGMSAGGLAEVTHEMCVDQCVNLITYHSCSDVSQLHVCTRTTSNGTFPHVTRIQTDNMITI